MRKEKYRQRIEAMINYTAESVTCRSQYLLQYFGEKNPERCGHCDVCLQKNELDITRYEFEKIIDDIRETVIKKPCKLDTLVDNINHREELVIKVVRWLLDQGNIHYDDKNVIHWQ